MEAATPILAWFRRIKSIRRIKNIRREKVILYNAPQFDVGFFIQLFTLIFLMSWAVLIPPRIYDSIKVRR